MAENTFYSVISSVYSLFEAYYSTIIAAIIIVLVGFIVGKLLGRIAQRVLHGMEVDHILKRALQTNIALEQATGKVTSYLIYIIAVIMALNQLRITTTVLHMIIAGVILVIIIAVVFAVKDFIPNAVAGFYLLKNEVIKKGQTIRVKGVEGTITDITLLETKLQTGSGDLVHIPNSSIAKSEVVTVRQRIGKKKQKER